MNSKQHDFGGITAVYYNSDDIVSLMLVPKGMEDKIAKERFSQPISLVQLHIDGDTIDVPYSQGISMVNSLTGRNLRFLDQTEREDEAGKTVITRLKGSHGEICTHYLTGAGNGYLRSFVTVKNAGEKPINLLSLQSFCLNGLTPFEPDDGANCMKLHKIQSYWSAEGRHIESTLEEIGFESCWTRNAAKSEKIFQVGTMPCRRYFPLYAIEDYENGCIWAAQLEWAGSWQMEAYRHGDNIALSGGLADFETGHWSRQLKAGEEITSPAAYLTCVKGGFDEATDALLTAQEDNYRYISEKEENLAPIYNEYCTTWGAPTYDKIKAQLESVKNLGLGYFVIDAGWYKKGGADWEVSEDVFPSLTAPAELIKQYGLTPGIWFEFEVTENEKTDRDLIVTRNGLPVKSFHRNFLNFTKKKTHAYLHEKVTDLLRKSEFGYIKVDYNDTYGIGFDGFDSYGEALRQNVYGVYSFFKEMKRQCPNLIIENCSSGGHRLEPSMQSLCAMGSFSDAHETKEIPIIAANLHRLILPRQSQVWAVLRKEDSIERINYSMSATFLGRCCISGDVDSLDETQISAVKDAIGFYKKCANVIKKGTTRIFREKVSSYRKPVGFQLVKRENEEQIMVVFHTFENGGKMNYEITGFEGYKICGCYGGRAGLLGSRLQIGVNGDFCGCVILLEKEIR